MGAVFLLVLLPVIGAVGFMLKMTSGDSSGGSWLAGAMILFLGAFLTFGAMRLAKGWDDESEAKH